MVEVQINPDLIVRIFSPYLCLNQREASTQSLVVGGSDLHFEFAFKKLRDTLTYLTISE
jgi:hypothetical protein